MATRVTHQDLLGAAVRQEQPVGFSKNILMPKVVFHGARQASREFHAKLILHVCVHMYIHVMYVCISIYIYVCSMYVCLSVCLPACLAGCLSVCLPMDVCNVCDVMYVCMYVRTYVCVHVM